MKKIQILLLLSLFSSFLKPSIHEVTYHEPTKLFLGAIQFPETISDNLCLYYKGQKLSTEWNNKNTIAQFSFLDSKYTQELYFVICDNFSYQTSQINTVQHLQLLSDSYKCYKLTAFRAPHKEYNQCSWSVEKKELHENIIPDNAFIFLFNPDFVEDLQVHSWSSDQSMRLLPTIKIKNIHAKELARAMTITQLAAIDIDTLHSKNSLKEI